MINRDILISSNIDSEGGGGGGDSDLISGFWLITYLSGRFQYVDIENEKSTQCPISCGIPQWSIRGPLLYLIYVNDIDKSTMGNILSFSEDNLYIYIYI